MSVTPATGHGRNQIVKLDNRSDSLTDITRYCRKISFKASEDNADVTAIGDKRIRRKNGLGDGTLDIDGLWHPTVDDILDAWLTFTKSVEHHPFGTGTGREKYTGEMIGSSYDIEIDFSAEVTFSASGEADGTITKGAN